MAPMLPAAARLIDKALAEGKFSGEPLEAMAAQLWLGHGGAGNPKRVEAARLIETYWRERGDDAYWDFLSNRETCSVCAETYKIENLAVCPACFKLQCPRHGRKCACGQATLG